MGHLTTEQILELVTGRTEEQAGKLALDHVHQCAECSRQFRTFQFLEMDLRTMGIPEVTPGFALKVTAKVREKETMKLFERPAFRLFRWSLILSAIVMLCILIYYSSKNTMSLPQWHFPGGVYFIISAICMSMIFSFDKMYSSFQRKM